MKTYPQNKITKSLIKKDSIFLKKVSVTGWFLFWSFLVGVIVFVNLPSLASAPSQQERSAEEKDYTAIKVSIIMDMYNCKNDAIYYSIMKSFDPLLVATVIAMESEYNINARSSRGCLGLMQLTPDKLKDWRNPVKNIQVGSSYLQKLIHKFQDLQLALAAYNAGPQNVKRYKGVPPFRETINFLRTAKRINQKVEARLQERLNKSF